MSFISNMVLDLKQKLFSNGRVLAFLILALVVLTTIVVMPINTSVASISSIDGAKNSFKYKTYFGDCPKRSVGPLTLLLVNDFESSHSLRTLKLRIVKENLSDKYFISKYRINYNPIEKVLFLSFECPAPLMRAQIYKKESMDSYEAILVENGDLFDPTYEVILRDEKKLKHDLPSLALPVGDLDKNKRIEIANLIKEINLDFRRKISEVILNEDNELTMILSVQNRPSSVFLGKDEWPLKLAKLQKIIQYMETQNRIPVVVNLTSSKKVVVKFNDKL